MGRKKKEESATYCAPSPDYFGPTPYIREPSYMNVTTLGDTERRYVTTTKYPCTSVTYTGIGGERTVYYPPKHWKSYTTTLGEDFMRQIEKEEDAKVKVNVEHFNGKYICCVKDTSDLLPEKILTTLSAVKGRLMIEVAPIYVKEFQCSMTPAVRKNIIQASKRARMYGKKIPIVAHFDEYGNRLPDCLDIGSELGVLIQIVEPEEYGEMYFELDAIVECEDSPF